ncbi:MAG: class I SAM-dependent methyltransferase [Ardenticatenaceae bacterium]
MSRVSFDNYGQMAQQGVSWTESSGRYSIQEANEKNIILDVVQKLKLSSKDELLEIGCGPGNLLIPLSFLVKSATGIDHPEILSRLSSRFDDNSIQKIPGNFLDINLSRTFDKILIYSVLHILSDEQEVMSFIQKAINLLNPGGILLLGDIANIDAKKRFLSTQYGKEFEQQWNEMMTGHFAAWHHLERDPKTVTFNDKLLMKILSDFRQQGLHTYVAPQPNNLPFGFTREDVIIMKLDK